MSITVVKEFSFEAAHFLPDHQGDCRYLHGHHYRLQVGFSGDIDKQTSMVIDFGTVKEMVRDILDELDHTCLNEVKYCNFPRKQPTAENMVVWIANMIVYRIGATDIKLTFVRLYETPTSYAEWRAN